MANQRVYGLDIFRAVAILLVVISHGGSISRDLFDFIPGIPLISGVELFFVLSGFLIGGIIIRIVERQDQFQLKDLWSFWIRRWFRTLPNYYLVLGLNVLLLSMGWVAGDLEQYNWKFWFFLHNFNSGFYGFFWESWSLSIEEWFYLFVPILVFLTLRVLPKQKALLLSILMAIGLPLLYRIYLADVEYDSFWVGIHISKVVLTRVDSIAYGVLAAYVSFYHPNLWKRFPNLSFLLGITLVYTLILTRGDSNQFFFRTFFFSLYSFGAMLLLIKADSIRSSKGGWFSTAITHISLISYSMYLLHFSVIIALIEHFVALETMAQKAIWYGVYWLATIALSTALYRWFEKPIMKLRDRF